MAQCPKKALWKDWRRFFKMAEQGLLITQKKDTERRGDASVKENLSIEILKQGAECLNCRFALLQREDNEIFCPLCGYGRKTCT